MSSSREVPAKFVESWRTEYIQTFHFLNVRIEAVRLEAKKLADREVNLLTPGQLRGIVGHLEQAQKSWEEILASHDGLRDRPQVRLYAAADYDWGDDGT